MTTENNKKKFIPDSDCGVLKKKIRRDGNEFAWTSGDLFYFFNGEIVLTIH